MKSKILAVILTLLFIISFSQKVFASTTYTVIQNDTLFKISQSFSVSIESIKTANNLTSDTIYIGQKLLIPSIQYNNVPTNNILTNDSINYTVVSGDNLWLLSKKFNTTISVIKHINNLNTDLLITGQELIITNPLNIISYSTSNTTHVEYINYIVKSGDNPWLIAKNFKVTYQEILSCNNLSSSSYLKIGQSIKVPVHIVPVKQTVAPQFGEVLQWFNEAQYVFYTGSIAKVTDFYTGKVFYIKRTIGANHADCETLTVKDTAIMKELWNNNWQWTNRPVIIEVNGRRLAASMAGMPHAGLDAYESLVTVTNRTGNYGTGPNYDFIKNNGMDGHFDVHFLNSTTHNTGKIDPYHQININIAGGK